MLIHPPEDESGAKSNEAAWNEKPLFSQLIAVLKMAAGFIATAAIVVYLCLKLLGGPSKPAPSIEPSAPLRPTIRASGN